MPSSGELNLKFDAPGGENRISAEVLIRTLKGVQDAVWELAKSATTPALVGSPSRVRIPEGVKDSFAIYCHAVEPGSFLLRCLVGLSTTQITAPTAEPDQVQPAQVLSQYVDFLKAVGAQDDREMKRAVPDAFWRDRLVRETLAFLPKPEEEWWIEIESDPQRDLQNAPPQKIRLDGRYRAVVQRLLERGDSITEGLASFVARIDSVDFKNGTIKVVYEPTNKPFKLKYEFDLEDSLVESRRRLVEIKAVCEWDAEGHPTAVREVRSITPHDLSPLVLSTVYDVDGHREFAIRPPLKLTPKSDDESRGELLVVEEPSLNLSACATTRAELEEEIIATLIFLWDEYADGDEEQMTLDARELKEALLNRISVKGSA